MFTGLIEETGIIKSARRSGRSIIFTVQGSRTVKGLRVDHSIAVDGTCLTVIKRRGKTFDVQAVEETLRKTTLGKLAAGDKVNLERPLLLSDRLGGHFVLGHVDGLGEIDSIVARKSSCVFWIRVPRRFVRHLVSVGSIAVNGVSLTMADVKGGSFAVSIIPHTLDVTTFGQLRQGDRVNLEFDILGKYVERMMKKR
jgi:riboflavin synthase